MAVKVFCSYAHEDDELRAALFAHLAGLRREGLIETWHDGRIVPGERWSDAITQALEDSQVILLLVSADFLNSDFCWTTEVASAVKRNRENTAVVIPIILRPCDWKNAPFGGLQALPEHARPITRWENRDDALLDVVSGIRTVVESWPPLAEYDQKPLAHVERTEESGKLAIQGTVREQSTKRPLGGVCVTLGPPIRCYTVTAADGRYFIDLTALDATAGSTWQLWFLRQGSATGISGVVVVSGTVTLDIELVSVA